MLRRPPRSTPTDTPFPSTTRFRSEYRVDRRLTQLAHAGILGKVAGVVFGQCTDCTNPEGGYSNFTIYEVLDRQFSQLGVPAFQGAEFGHIAGQMSIDRKSTRLNSRH